MTTTRPLTAGLTPVVETNCHPYTFGRHVIAHNGVLASFELFKPQLLSLLPLRYRVSILGTTDSEHMAALYMFLLCGEHGDWDAIYPATTMAATMRRTIGELNSMVDSVSDQASSLGGPPPHSALNLVVSSGANMVTLRYASPTSREPPSLYYSTTAGPTLNRKYKGHPDKGVTHKPVKVSEGSKDKEQHGKHVIVASEPCTYDAAEWELVKPGEMVLVERGDIVGLEQLGV